MLPNNWRYLRGDIYYDGDIPVTVLQGSMTALAVVLFGVMTDAVLNDLSLVGNILIFCVGINLVWPKTIKVANLLPSLLVAVAMTGIL